MDQDYLKKIFDEMDDVLKNFDKSITFSDAVKKTTKIKPKFDWEMYQKENFNEYSYRLDFSLKGYHTDSMPIEYTQLKNRMPAFTACKLCGTMDPEFLRGQVQSDWRKFFKLPYCAVICHACKQIIGWEKP